MGIVKGFLPTKDYIRKVFKVRGLDHLLKEVDLDEVSQKELHRLHSLAVNEENVWHDTLFKFVFEKEKD